MHDRYAAAEQVIRLVAGRWTLPVLAELQDTSCRYQGLGDALGAVSHKVLTDTLRRAERDGLVSRHLDPVRLETATVYQLTDLGRSLDEPLMTFERWAIDSWREVEEARRRWGTLLPTRP